MTRPAIIEETRELTLEHSVTESALAAQFVAFDHTTWPMRQALSRNLWVGWLDAKSRVPDQHTYLQRVLAELAKLGSYRSIGGLWPYLYLGCALMEGFTPAHLQEGELIGKALDRLGLSREVVAAHLEAGNLAEVVKAARAVTTPVRVTAAAKDALDDAATMARKTVDTSGLSAPEVRAILPQAYLNASPQLKAFLVRLGAGEVDTSRTFIVEAQDTRPSESPHLQNAAPPISFIGWGKLNAPCWVCHRTPAQSGLPHHAHHVQAGAHEARPNDSVTEPLWAFVCPACHVPQPSGHTNTAHNREYALHLDAVKLHAYLRYFAHCFRLYQQAIGAVPAEATRPGGDRSA